MWTQRDVDRTEDWRKVVPQIDVPETCKFNDVHDLVGFCVIVQAEFRALQKRNTVVRLVVSDHVLQFDKAQLVADAEAETSLRREAVAAACGGIGNTAGF